MPSIWSDLLKLPASAMEAGVNVIDAGAKTLRSGIDVIAGPKPKSHAPPVNGPQNLDSALSDFANQAIRLAWIGRPEGIPLTEFTAGLVRSAKRAFSYLDPGDPRTYALPLELPFSLGGIAAETMLRMIAATSVVGPKRLPTFVANAAEVYCEVEVFIGLEYKDLIERYRKHLQEKPKDYATHLELGRLYIKCGLYDSAVKEFDAAAAGPTDIYARAKHESVVAHLRAGRYEKAIEAGVAALKVDPNNERARVVAWLASRMLGDYPPGVPAGCKMQLKAGLEPTKLRYENIAAKIGMDKICGGRGTAIFDYNNDGLLDILVTASHAGCTLYRNNGDGTFTDVSTGSGLDQCINGFVVVAADYDNDGFVDIFVTRQGFYYGNCDLYHNNGDGTFTNVTKKAGVENWGPAYTAGFVDYDCDGNLDLFVAFNLGGMFDRHSQNRLFHNNGDGTFTDVTEKAGISSVFTTIGSCWGDYNNDGYPDLFLSSGLGRPQLFRNNRDGTFTDVSAEAGLDQFVVGTTCAFFDYDNDGWLDIVQFSWADHEDSIHTMQHGKGPDDGAPLIVYRNNRDGTFTALTREIGLTGCWGTMAGNLGDINNDGYVDLLLGNGSPRMERFEPFVLLENDRGRFRNTTFSAGLPYFGKSHGTNCADLFGDGRMSIIIAAGGGYPGDLQPIAVHYPNELPGNYLNVRLRGTKSNRDGFGARITLHTAGSRQLREVSHGSSFGCLPSEQHFGLGDITKIDALEIRWPSGLKQRIANPPVNETIRITEGNNDWEFVYRAAAADSPSASQAVKILEAPSISA